NQVKNKIVAFPGGANFRWKMINFGYVEIKGLDVKVQSDWKFNEEFFLQARATYTYQEAQDLTSPESPYYGAQLPYTPWHSGSMILNSIWKSWGFNYSFVYTGDRYEAAAEIPENYVPRWYTHDLGLTKSFSLYGKSMRMSAEVNNLLNQQFEVVESYPMPGTNYRFTLNIKL
ncbi:MAG: TonB-dependent receptor, partial [Pedobacter sp.]